MNASRVKYGTLYVLSIFLGVACSILLYKQTNIISVDRNEFISPLTTGLNTKMFTFPLDIAPPDSLRGKISTFSGEVFIKPRASSDFRLIDFTQLLQQGDELSSSESGSLMVAYKEGDIRVLNNSHIELIQMLPVQFVFMQDRGSIEYTVNSVTPFAVRSSSMIAVIFSGLTKITVEPNEKRIMIYVDYGDTVISFNSKEYISRVIPLKSKELFIYDTEKHKGFIYH